MVMSDGFRQEQHLDRMRVVEVVQTLRAIHPATLLAIHQVILGHIRLATPHLIHLAIRHHHRIHHHTQFHIRRHTLHRTQALIHRLILHHLHTHRHIHLVIRLRTRHLTRLVRPIHLVTR